MNTHPTGHQSPVLHEPSITSRPPVSTETTTPDSARHLEAFEKLCQERSEDAAKLKRIIGWNEDERQSCAELPAAEAEVSFGDVVLAYSLLIQTYISLQIPAGRLIERQKNMFETCCSERVKEAEVSAGDYKVVLAVAQAQLDKRQDVGRYIQSCASDEEKSAWNTLRSRLDGEWGMTPREVWRGNSERAQGRELAGSRS